MECKQTDTESLTEFAVRLDRARRMCGISVDDNRMRVALISGARNNRMRKEAEGSANSFDYKDLLKMGTRFEAAEAHEAEAKKMEQKEILAVDTQPSTSQGYRGGNAQFYRGGRAARSRGGFSGMRGSRQGSHIPMRTQPQQYGQPWRPARGGFQRQVINAPGSCKCCGLVHTDRVCGATMENCGLCGVLGHYGRCCMNFTTSAVTPQQVTSTDKV